LNNLIELKDKDRSEASVYINLIKVLMDDIEIEDEV